MPNSVSLSKYSLTLKTCFQFSFLQLPNSCEFKNGEKHRKKRINRNIFFIVVPLIIIVTYNSFRHLIF